MHQHEATSRRTQHTGAPPRGSSIFLIAADVADHEGIAGVEATALMEIAAALQVDPQALLGASPVLRRDP